MNNTIETSVHSEIGKLEGVILHSPGNEIENMTPENAERALYSDILNLSVAKKEYIQLEGVLNKFCKTFQVKDLLKDVLNDDIIKYELLTSICTCENTKPLKDKLLNLSSEELAKQLIEGVPVNKNTLSTFLNDERYSLRPLHNFFFTRDASMTLYDKVLIGKMANKVRERESLVMNTIFNHSSLIKSSTINPNHCEHNKNQITIEGGDVQIARDDILIVGTGLRTSTQGIDFIADILKNNNPGKHYIVVQQLPLSPESFIHLDMVFTLLDKDNCMIYEPIIMQPNKYQTILITIDNNQVQKIDKKDNLLNCLKELGMDLKPIFCGGRKDLWIQEREQWHSGANFLAIAPGKVIGYARNTYTLEDMNNNGYEIISAKDVIENKVDPNNYKKYVITIQGSELARGGGGARCMTMPIRRKKINW